MITRPHRRTLLHTSLGSWELIEASPAPDLSGVVDYFWEGDGTIQDFTEKILPTGAVDLMFNLGGDHRVLERDGQSRNDDYPESWLSGMQSRYLTIRTRNGSHLLSARLKPWGAWHLLRQSMTTVTGEVPRLSELWGDRIHALTERLRAAPNAFARFDLLEHFLRRRLQRRRRNDSAVITAAGWLQASKGRLPIERISRELGVNRTTLSRRFRQQVGLPPKVYGRVMRLNALIQTLAAGSNTSMAELADHFGYYDQAHFSRDFRRFAGATPSEYLHSALADGGAILVDGGDTRER